MTDDRHVDRYVRITNRERFLIVRALGLLESAYETLGLAEDGEVWLLKRVFCEENWMNGHYIRHTNKVVSVQTME